MAHDESDAEVRGLEQSDIRRDWVVHRVRVRHRALDPVPGQARTRVPGRILRVDDVNRMRRLGRRPWPRQHRLHRRSRVSHRLSQPSAVVRSTRRSLSGGRRNRSWSRGSSLSRSWTLLGTGTLSRGLRGAALNRLVEGVLQVGKPQQQRQSTDRYQHGDQERQQELGHRHTSPPSFAAATSPSRPQPSGSASMRRPSHGLGVSVSRRGCSPHRGSRGDASSRADTSRAAPRSSTAAAGR